MDAIHQTKSAASTQLSLAYRARPPHVLVVDEDPEVRLELANYLTAHDMRVTGVGRGQDLFEVFESETIDLVLLDVRIPGGNGLLLAQALRARTSVPIMLWTGNAEEA